MKKVKILLVAMIIILPFIFWSCQDKNEVKIGVIIPLTGDVATYGKSVKDGMDIALEEMKNEAKFRYKLIYEDSKGKPSTAINALEKLFLEKVDYFVGDATSSVTYEIGPRIKKKSLSRK